MEHSNDEEISYQMVRKVLLQPSESIRRREKDDNRRFVEDLRSKPFEEIKSRVHERVRPPFSSVIRSCFHLLAKTRQSTTGTIIECSLSSS